MRIILAYGDRHGDEEMTSRRQFKYIHEGRYVAEVDVELIDSADGWSPQLSIHDVYHLDDVRDALRRGDLTGAARHSRVFTLTSIVE